jgi:hypothetical protein
MVSASLVLVLPLLSLLTLAKPAPHALFRKVVLTNDDGWAVLTVRAQNDALKKAGFNVRAMRSVCVRGESALLNDVFR